MNKNKIILKGIVFGKTLKKYDNPDIIKSTVDNFECEENNLTINYDKKSGKYSIYHSYEGYEKSKKIYSGRWYDLNILFEKKFFNEKNKTFSFILKNIDWVDFSTGKSKIKNVKIKIYFSENGYKKLENFINH